jgi:hypothetical protein
MRPHTRKDVGIGDYSAGNGAGRVGRYYPRAEPSVLQLTARWRRLDRIGVKFKSVPAA